MPDEPADETSLIDDVDSEDEERDPYAVSPDESDEEDDEPKCGDDEVASDTDRRDEKS